MKIIFCLAVIRGSEAASLIESSRQNIVARIPRSARRDLLSFDFVRSGWLKSNDDFINGELKRWLLAGNNRGMEEFLFPGKIELQLKGLFLDDSALLGAVTALLAPAHMPEVAPPLQRLVLLNLSHNHLTDAACSVLGEVVSRSHTLRMLDLRGNRITSEGRHVLLEALERNGSVQSVSHKLEMTMIEGLRGSDSIGPLRIDIRPTEASDTPESTSSHEEPSSAHNDPTPSAAVGSTKSARKRRVHSASVRRRIRSAQLLDSTVEIVASDNQRTNGASNSLTTDVEPQDQNRLAEEMGHESEIDYEHLSNLQVIAGIDSGTDDLLKHGTQRKLSYTVTHGSGNNTSAMISKKSRPMSAPSLSQRTMQSTRRIYEASPFPLTPNTDVRGLESAKPPVAEITNTRTKTRRQRTDNPNSAKGNTGSEKRYEGGPSAKTKKLLQSTSSKNAIDELEMFNPLKIF